MQREAVIDMGYRVLDAEDKTENQVLVTPRCLLASVDLVDYVMIRLDCRAGERISSTVTVLGSGRHLQTEWVNHNSFMLPPANQTCARPREASNSLTYIQRTW